MGGDPLSFLYLKGREVLSMTVFESMILMLTFGALIVAVFNEFHNTDLLQHRYSM